jgi:hypothetical protein
MPRRCSICHHPDVGQIDAALSGGGSISEISAKQGVSIDALKRHRANHLLPEMRVKLAADPELRDVDVLAEMRSLYARMRNHLERVEGSDNWQAIKAFHSEARQDLELLAKLLGDLDTQPTVNVLIAPTVQAVIIAALEPYPDARQAVADALKEIEAA